MQICKYALPVYSYIRTREGVQKGEQLAKITVLIVRAGYMRFTFAPQPLPPEYRIEFDASWYTIQTASGKEKLNT